MSKPKDASAWQALGIDRGFMEATADGKLDSLDLWWVDPPDSPDEVERWASGALPSGMDVFAMGALGYSLRPPLDDWQAVGRRTVAAALHYFFGKWRQKFTYFGQPMDYAKSRAELPWIDRYRYALAIASALGDWRSADRLLEWPGPDLKDDEGLDDRTKEDNAYHLWLAARLRGEPEKAVAAHRARIERSSRRRPKMLLTAADALLAGDPAGLATAVGQYLRHYRKVEFDPPPVSDGVCVDAAVLWHFARRRGLGEVPLPPDLGLMIPRCPDAAPAPARTGVRSHQKARVRGPTPPAPPAPTVEPPAPTAEPPEQGWKAVEARLLDLARLSRLLAGKAPDAPQVLAAARKRWPRAWESDPDGGDPPAGSVLEHLLATGRMRGKRYLAGPALRLLCQAIGDPLDTASFDDAGMIHIFAVEALTGLPHAERLYGRVPPPLKAWEGGYGNLPGYVTPKEAAAMLKKWPGPDHDDPPPEVF